MTNRIYRRLARERGLTVAATRRTWGPEIAGGCLLLIAVLVTTGGVL